MIGCRAKAIYSAFACLFFLIAIFTGCSTDKKRDESKSSEKTEATDSVVAVIDGDTFVLAGNRTVRIAIIDTPEKYEPLHNEATSRLAGLILNKRVILNPVGAGVDHYGRILASITIDTIDVARNMLEAGLGVLYLFDDNAYLKNKYLPAQIRALDANAGLWGLPEPPPEDFYINLKGSYRFHRPLCPHLKKSNPDKIIRIEERELALRQGLAPCRTCKP